jgi:predicted Zn-dependent protease
MADPAKRLVYLEKVTREGTTDPFPWYGLALEYRNLGRVDEALQTFTALRASTPTYVPMAHRWHRRGGQGGRWARERGARRSARATGRLTPLRLAPM